MHRPSACLLLVLATMLVPREHAPAGVPLVDVNGLPYRWDLVTAQPNVIGGKVTFFPNSGSLRDEISGQKTALEAIRDAIHEWEIGTTAIRFQEDTSRPATGPNGTDRVNYVGFVQSGLDSLVLAVTTVTCDRPATCTSANLADMDITLNDRDFTWDTFSPGRAGIADIQGLVTHEWGHAIGCDHVPLRTSTMYALTQPGVTSLRSISPDDRSLVGANYPNALFQTATGSITGVVDLVGSTNDRAIHVVAVSVVSGEPESSTLTRPNGTYRLDGLPAGVYRIIAAPCLPLGASMNKFWASGSTSFLPSVLRQGAGNPAPILPLAVVAGQTIAAPAMSVAAATAPFEPNDSMSQATPIEVGQALCARFESGSDEDWYSFTGALGQKVTISVLSWGLGAAADPALELVGPSGSTVALQEDVRPPQIYRNQIEGQDLDVRLVGFALAQSGKYLLRLRDQISSPGGNGFYVLMLTPSSDAPSTVLTSVSATPSRLDATGASVSGIVVRPKRETGDDIGPGATVTLSHMGDGVASVVTDAGDGTYVAHVTSPAAAGQDRFTVVVATPQGTATLLDAFSLVYLGPVDAAKSTFTVIPRRVAAGVLAQSTVMLVPRDAQGEPLGLRRTVLFGLVAPQGAALVGPVDLGDGSYGDTVKGTALRGDGVVSASVDGVALGATARISFGFGFAEVLADVVADVQGYIATQGLSSKGAKALAKSEHAAAAAISVVADGGPKAERRAVAAAQAILSQVISGRAKAGVPLPSPGTERDLAGSIREAAARVIAAAVAVSAGDRRKVDAANAALAKGDAAASAEDVKKAAAQWRSAYERVLSLQPR